MAISIILKKINENNEFVTYSFETDIPEGIGTGVAKFNKESLSLTLENELTHPYLLDENIKQKILIRLLKMSNDANYYPNLIEYAA